MPSNRPNEFIKTKEALEWLNVDKDEFHRVDGTVVSYTNGAGDEFFFKEQEVEVIIEKIIEKVIVDKNIDMYKEITDGFQDFVKNNIEELEKRSKDYYFKKIDAVAQKLAEKMLDYKIEEEINKRVDKLVEQKFKEIEKLLKK